MAGLDSASWVLRGIWLFLPASAYHGISNAIEDVVIAYRVKFGHTTCCWSMFNVCNMQSVTMLVLKFQVESWMKPVTNQNEGQPPSGS
jgi:hypothetical protein